MGKGDRKTAKGKRNISSYGNVRPAKVTKTVVAKKATTTTAAKPVVKKAAAPKKKPAAKAE